jgi:small-conductance mechanosensitive channel
LVGLATAALIAILIWRRSDIQSLFDSPIRVTGGTVFATGFVLLITAIVLSLWGSLDRLVGLYEQSEATTLFLKLMLTLMTCVVTYGVLMLAKVTVTRVANRRTVIDAHAEQVIYRVTQLVSGAGAIFVVLTIWDINVANLLLGAGFLGIIVGLAARQSLAAGLSGLVLMFSRPFKIGDWVEIEEKRGIVVKITLVNTQIRAYSGEYIIIPNNIVSESELTNLTTTGRLQLRIDVGIDYNTDIQTAIQVAEEAIEELDSVEVPQVEVQPVGFGASSVNLAVYFSIANPNETLRRRAQAEAIELIKDAFDEHSITIPFPQRTLSERSAKGDESVDA